jgi:Protein of unknown function (DUF2634)
VSTIEPDALNFDLIPPDPGLINPDLQLDTALAPVEDTDPEQPLPLGRAWRFDFTTGQFIRDGLAPKVTYELDSLIVWIEKTLRTARYAHPIYSDDYGMEDPYSVVGMQANEELLTTFQDAIAEALLVHDRITNVENFSFNQDPFDEGLYASFTVTLDGAPPLEDQQPLEFTDVPLSQQAIPSVAVPPAPPTPPADLLDGGGPVSSPLDSVDGGASSTPSFDTTIDGGGV